MLRQLKPFLICLFLLKLVHLTKRGFVSKFNMFVTERKPKLFQLYFYFRKNFTEIQKLLTKRALKCH